MTYKEKLLDLLAILHADGGHHVENVGLDQAIEDAKAKYFASRQQLKDNEELIQSLRDEIESLEYGEEL